MPKAYPREFRERVLRAHDRGLKQEEVAEQFDISRTALLAWLPLRRRTGDIDPLPRGGGMPAKVDAAVLEQVRAELPDETRAELTALYSRKVPRTGRVHESSAYRALLRLGYVSKANSGGRRSKSDQT